MPPLREPALLLAMVLAIPSGADAGRGASPARFPSDSEVRRILGERVSALGGPESGIGIVVGLLDANGRRVVCHGRRGEGEPSVDGDTVFEVGSVTKVFTGLLLADMVRRGELALADPVAKHLPAGAKVPRQGGRSITLLDLATHTAGLPFMPDDLPAFDDPEGLRYSKDRLYAFLARCELASAVGERWDYSNVGYWLLGEALAARAGTDFARLLGARVLSPLGLKSTALAASPTLAGRLAVGHNAALQPAPSLPAVPAYSLIPAAGGVVSTAEDVLTFLSAAMGRQPSPLAPALSDMLLTRRPKGPQGESQAIGWLVSGDGEEALVFHDGGTLGFASALAWDPQTRRGVVVLANQISGVDDIARHLLRPGAPLDTPRATRRKEVALDPAVLAAYAGQYEDQEEGTFSVVHERGALTIRLPASWGLPPLRVRPESRSDFFALELPLRLRFEADRDGRVTGMLVYPPRGQRAIATRRAGGRR